METKLILELVIALSANVYRPPVHTKVDVPHKQLQLILRTGNRTCTADMKERNQSWPFYMKMNDCRNVGLDPCSCIRRYCMVRLKINSTAEIDYGARLVCDCDIQ